MSVVKMLSRVLRIVAFLAMAPLFVAAALALLSVDFVPSWVACQGVLALALLSGAALCFVEATRIVARATQRWWLLRSVLVALLGVLPTAALALLGLIATLALTICAHRDCKELYAAGRVHLYEDDPLTFVSEPHLYAVRVDPWPILHRTGVPSDGRFARFTVHGEWIRASGRSCIEIHRETGATRRCEQR